MPKLTKIYTKTGDDGQTSLGTRERVPKDALRVKAYGDVDELNSLVGLAMAAGLAPRLGEVLPAVQNELFHLGSDLAFPDSAGESFQVPRMETRHVEALEKVIDGLLDIVGPLENFILPGGCIGSAYLHVARTICRRAERSVISLAREETINPVIIQYLNRLSDALFVMARYENHFRGVDEPFWDSRG
jgi:cob(I)alamin adenosyltransferase